MTETRSRSALRFWLGIVIAVLVTLLILVGVIVYVAGCAVVRVGQALETDTKVAVNATTASGQLELDLKYGHEATGISSITFTDTAGNKLWELTGQGTTKPAKVVYGQVPTDGSLKQTFPTDGKPPPEVRGKTVQVRVNNRFQVALGPGHEITDVTVEVPK